MQFERDLENGYSSENTFSKDFIAALKKADIRVSIITNHYKFKLDEPLGRGKFT